MIPWTHPTQHAKLHLDRFSRFCRAYDRHISMDGRTDRRRYSVCNNRSHLRSTAMRCWRGRWQPTGESTVRVGSLVPQGWRPWRLICIHHEPGPGELSQWLCHDHSTINTGIGIVHRSIYYTVNHKKRDILFLTITLANLNRFLQFLYHFNREEILHATLIKFITSP